MSISQHSEFKKLYIFSVQQANLDYFENHEAHELITDYLTCVNMPYIELEGCYLGKTEKSLLVDANGISEDSIMNICKRANQESYLVLENHKHGLYKAVLTFTANGRRLFLGYLREISKDIIDALNLDYSYRPEVNKYFTVWPTDTTVMSTFESEVNFAKANGLKALANLKDKRIKIK